jgi:hypothetical protein
MEGLMIRMPRMVFTALVGLVLLVTPLLAATQPLELLRADDFGIALRVGLQDVSLRPVVTERGVFTEVEVADQGFTTAIGAARLPVLRHLIELPLGAVCAVTIENPSWAERSIDAPVQPLQPPLPKSGPRPAFAYDAAAYARPGYGDVPVAAVEEVGILRGHRLAQLVVNPVAYDPVAGRLRTLESATVRIDFTGADRTGTDLLRTRYASPPFDGVVARTTLNGERNRYQPGGEIGMLVIVTPAFMSDIPLTEFIATKFERGLRVTVVSTADTGPTKELIKAYIQNAYDTWTVPPTFVLLVGDTPDIPHWIGIGADSPPTDLNYTMLAGSDYFPDVEIGRLSATNPTDLHNAIAKITNFEQVGWTGNDDWEKHATFMASNDNYTVSEGTHNYVISTYLQPLGYTSDKLYVHTYGATTQQVRDAFNGGRSQGTYSGHGAESYWADGPVFYQTDVRNLTNTVYPFVTSFACLTGNFAYGSECFGETWIRTAHGAMAFFGSSVTSYWTEDDIFEKRIYQGIYDDQNPGEVDRTWLGGMLLYGKLKYYDHFGNISMTRRYFEMYNLLGDPSVDLWTAVPATPIVQAPTTLLTGQTSFEVTVPGFPNALIFVQKSDDGIADIAWTDALGHATVNLSHVATPGLLWMTITAHNMRPYHGTIQVIQPSGPYLVYESHRVDDWWWDNDGVADAGETDGIFTTVRNIGVDTATGVSIVFGTDDPYVVAMTLNEPGFPDIPPGESRESLTSIDVGFSGRTPDQHVVTFGYGIHSNEGLWSGEFTTTVQAPALEAGRFLIDDSAPGGNGNGVADPGETFYMMLWLANSGHAGTGELTGTLGVSDPHATILDADGSSLGIPVGERMLMSAFRIALAGDCPSPMTLPLFLAVSGPMDFAANLDLFLPVGAFSDDAEQDRGWTCNAPGDNAVSGIWTRAEPVGTTYNGQQCQPEYDHTVDPGQICWVTGNGSVGGAAGEVDVDGGKTTLLSPVFDLDGAISATVGYWRWYTNNLGNNPDQDFWDVDVTSDGTNWVHLEHTTASANSWNPFSFSIGDYVPLTDQVRFRFVANDVSPNSLLEAAVDDFQLQVVFLPPSDATDGPADLSVGLVSCSPNPMSPKTTITYRAAAATRGTIGIYDVNGRLVRRLVEGAIAPGEHAAGFDGRDGAGNALPSGIYFIRLETPEILEVRQVTLLK